MAGIVVAGALGGAVGGTIIRLRDKDQIRKRDEEIGEERDREREIEREKDANRPLEVGIAHHLHEHPLNEVVGDEEQFVCGACNRTGTGRRYGCENADCCFQMHRVCASSPVMLVGDFQPDAGAPALQTLETFAHSGHTVKEVYKHGEKYDCGHCKIPGEGISFLLPSWINHHNNMYMYRCDECDINLHPICAKSPTRLTSVMHPEHELDLITRPHFADCAVCGHGKKSNNRVYACLECKFYLHPTCSQWPHYLFHELHPVVHPLQFEILSPSSSSQRKCSACKKKCKTTLYHCSHCDESFHPECLLRFSLSGKADGKMDRFRKEVVKHTAFHVGFIGLKSAMTLVLL